MSSNVPQVIPMNATGVTPNDITRLIGALTVWSKSVGSTLVDLEAECAAIPELDDGDLNLAFVVWKAADTVISETAASIVPNSAAAPFQGDRHREALAKLWRPLIDHDGSTLTSNVQEALTVVDAMIPGIRTAITEVKNAQNNRVSLVQDLALIRDLSRQLEMSAGELSALEQAASALSNDTPPAEVNRVSQQAAQLRATLETAVAERGQLLQALQSEAATLAQLRELEKRANEASALSHEKLLNPPRLGIPSMDALGPTPAAPDLATVPWPAARAQLSDRASKLSRMKQAYEHVIAKHEEAMQERQSLRGLVDAYRAKAMAARIGERNDVAAAYATCRELLWSAPCDLDQGRVAVQAYVQLVMNAPTSASVSTTTPPSALPQQGQLS